MAKMSDDHLLTLVESEIRTAVGYWSGKLAGQRQKAMQYYYCEATGDLAPPEVEGRSSVVAPVVRNVIESILPQLMVRYAGTERPVEFRPRKPGDEKAAEQATDYVSYVYHDRNAGEMITYAWMKDALLSKRGILKVWWDDRFEEKSEEYKGLDDIELAQLDDDEEVTITESRSYPDEEDGEQRQEAIDKLGQQLQQAQQAAQQGDQRAMQAAQQLIAQIEQIKSMPPKLLYDVTAIRREGGGRIRVENVPPEEFLISRKAKDIDNASFVGHRVLRSMSELRTMGYTNVEHIGGGDDGMATLNAERIERLQYDDEYSYLADQDQTLDESQRKVWVTECYVRADYDGDGITELRRVVRAGGQLLANEICDVAPFVSICPIPLTHKFFGLSLADLAMESQRVETALLRGVLDNAYLQINGRYFAVDGQVNLDDLLTSRPGGVVRIKQPGAAGRLDQGAGDANIGMGMLQYMQGFREDATGYSKQSQGVSGTSLTDPMSATQANIVASSADARVDLIARVFAEGFRDLYRLILKLCSQYQDKEDIINLRGEWTPINPREWRRGFECAINVGVGIGSKDQQVAHLMAFIQQIQMGLQDGTSTPENLYQARAELAKLLGFRSGDKFLTDPAKMPPKQPQPSPDVMAKTQADMQAKQMQLQQDAQHFQADMQLKMQAQQMAHDARMAEIQKQYELQASNDQRDAQREQMKAAYEAQRAQAEQENAKVIQAMRGELEKYKADLDAQVKLTIAQQAAAPAVDIAPVQAALDQMIAHLAAPMQIIRGPDGRAVGVKKGDLVKQIQRGPDGRAVGVQ